MSRLGSKKEDEQIPVPPQAAAQTPQVQRTVEVEVNLSLLNDKLNYLINCVHQIADASDIELKQVK